MFVTTAIAVVVPSVVVSSVAGADVKDVDNKANNKKTKPNPKLSI